MATYPTSSLLVTDIPDEVLDLQRQANTLFAQMPCPDLSTPEGLVALRASTANNEGITELTPTEMHVEGPHGRVRLRVFNPGSARAVFYRIHGGGWAAGAPGDDDVLNDRIARGAGVVIVSPEYRLAPQFGVAQQIAETTAIASWLGQHAVDLFGSDTLLIGGTSAGGHLAAATLLGLRDARDPAFTKFAAAHLDCGGYDLGGSPSLVLADATSLILTRDLIDGLVQLGLPDMTVEQRRAPNLSPAFNDLHDFPPTLLTVGDLDPLRDDSVIFGARLQLAGREAQVDVWPECAHAFTNMATPLGEVALVRTISWLRSQLDTHASPTAPVVESKPSTSIAN